jgi:predicted ArsR family transcriptional regulator
MSTEEQRRGRDRVLRAVADAPGGETADDLAEILGLHRNSVRFHLERLEADGLITGAADRRGSPGRPRRRYTVTEHGHSQVGDDARSWRLLAQTLVEELAGRADARDVAIAAGERLGRVLADPDADPLDRVDAVLEMVGFAPKRVAGDSGEQQVWLRRCPFLDAAREHPDVVCSVHLGLLHGTVDASPVEVAELRPFAAPEGCLARLTVPRD